MAPTEVQNAELSEELARMQTIDSLDYVTSDNSAFRKDTWRTTKRDVTHDEAQRLTISLVIGLFIGGLAFFIEWATELIVDFKVSVVEDLYHKRSPFMAYFAFVGLNSGLVLVGTTYIACLCLEASGAGIADVKGYLNGVRLRQVVNLKTLAGKLLGTLAHVTSSLPCSLAGPMIHIGAIIGGSISQPRSETLGINLPFIYKFASDRDRRDFISLGSACGVAAVFNAPIGGILFMLEECSSFWSPTLTVRTFLATMVSVLTANSLAGAQSGDWGVYKLLVQFETPHGESSAYRWLDLLIALLYGILGGLAGALFVRANMRLMRWRRARVNPWASRRILEVLCMTVLVSTAFFAVALVAPCEPATLTGSDGDPSGIFGNTTVPNALVFNCNASAGDYNPMASILMSSNTHVLRNLLAPDPRFTFGYWGLALHVMLVGALSCIVAGATVSGGNLITSLMIGAAAGRLGALALHAAFPAQGWNIAALSVIGAAAFLAGVTRMTISLVVIMIELTNNLQYLAPIMLTVMAARFIGDRFSPPLYNSLLRSRYVPYLAPEPTAMMKKLVARDLMASPLITLAIVTPVTTVLQVLTDCSHNGFPVVAPHERDRVVPEAGLRGSPDGLLMGMITRRELLLLLAQRVWERQKPGLLILGHKTPTLTAVVRDLSNASTDLQAQLDLAPYMNRSPFRVHGDFSCDKAFRLFRGLGLRHLPVVDDNNEAIGMITRKDLLEQVVEARGKALVAKMSADPDALMRRLMPNTRVSGLGGLRNAPLSQLGGGGGGGAWRSGLDSALDRSSPYAPSGSPSSGALRAGGAEAGTTPGTRSSRSASMESKSALATVTVAAGSDADSETDALVKSISGYGVAADLTKPGPASRGDISEFDDL